MHIKYSLNENLNINLGILLSLFHPYLFPQWVESGFHLLNQISWENVPILRIWQTGGNSYEYLWLD